MKLANTGWLGGVSLGLAITTGCGLAALCIALSGISGLLPPGTYYYLPFCAFVLCCLTAIYPVLQKSGRDSSAVVLVCAITLLFLLSFGLVSWHLLPTRWLDFGMFQRGDALDFLSSAQTLLHDGTFYTPRGRVFSNVLYAGMLDVTDYDLLQIGWILTGLAALGTAAAILSANTLLGVIGGVFTAYILFEFSHEHIGGISTEMPGFILGALAVPFLYKAVQARSHAAFLAGFALIMAAMLARVGAVFVLPALLLWAVVHLRGTVRQRIASTVLAGVLAVLLVAGNSALTRHVSPGSGGSFVNAVPSWYAVIVEGQLLTGERDESSVMPVTRWVQIVADHPEIIAAPLSERPALQMSIFLDALVEHPVAAFVGGVAEIGRYLAKMRMYNFIEIKPVRILFALLAFLGVARSLRGMWRGRSAIHDFFGLMALALIFSQPFLYGGETRTPAPSVALLAGLSAIGLMALLEYFERLRSVARQLQGDSSETHGGVWFSSCVLSAITACIVAVFFTAGFFALGTHAVAEAPIRGCTHKQARVLVLKQMAAIETGRIRAALAFVSSFGADKNRLRSMTRSIRPSTYAPWDPVLETLQRSGFVGYGIEARKGTLVGPVFAQRPTSGDNSTICAVQIQYGLQQTR